MSVLLSISAFEQAAIRYLDFGGLLRPTMGGPDQRLNRIGNRFAVDYEVGEVRSDTAEGRALRQQLIRAKTQGAIALFPQDGTALGVVGSPVVNGAGQTGGSINIRDFTPNFQVPVGTPFSIIVGGRRYLYTADSDWGATAQGRLIMPISPMIRATPSDGAVVEMDTPYIEGFITSDISFVYNPGNWQGQTVTIEEAA